MLNKFSRRDRVLRLLPTVLMLALLGLLVSALAMAQLLDGLSSAVAIRNALLASTVARANLNWAPPEVPHGFKQEEGPIPPEIAQVAQRLVAESGSNGSLATALAIARHLRAPRIYGEPIMADTLETYRRIIGDKTGYCSDYTQVFNGLAVAARVPVREWGIAWTDFGVGHAFNEIYDSTLHKWVLVDPFLSVYMRDPATGEPLSALEVRDRLVASERASIEVVPIVLVVSGSQSQAQVLDYYRRGINQLYLFWGNNVFSYDRNFLVKMGATVSRATEQVAAIVVGVHPRVRILTSEANETAIARLYALRHKCLLILSALITSFLVVTTCTAALYANARHWL